MKKWLLMSFAGLCLATSGYSQSNRFWSADNENRDNILTDKAVLRQAYPKAFKLFRLNYSDFKQQLFSAVGNRANQKPVIISLPNAAGAFEDFEVTESSNFESALQERFPDIRSFSGKGITDKSATLKLSVSPQGIQTTVFRTGVENEFIEPYSKDHAIYSVFTSQRDKSKLPWKCTTPDEQLANDLDSRMTANVVTARSGGNLKTLRLAQSVTAEYSNYFGATSASQVALVLAAVNNTLTRCNGVYEKDLAVHLNLVANTTDVFYYDPNTDPYSPAAVGALGAWNGQLQKTLNSNIGAANYDIGHLFGASGGGGNAGCIGCICLDGSKGKGFTSPADGIPEGDNFDIDYVVHEVGHQLGANHTFSYSSEGTGVNVEIGSGITIMGYAGITSYDVAPHSIDIYHGISITQIQANLDKKSCPVTLANTNATPVVAAVSNITIPKGTPFALTGSATDANANNVLTYCWEEIDNVSGQTKAKSSASPTKTAGPNWISFKPTTSPVRVFPQLATILAGDSVTASLPGGDANTKIEALSSVARTLNFRLTVRDNAAYSTTAPISVGQTSYTDMVVTVDGNTGPFKVTSPNTSVSWASGSQQTITWDVASTTVSPINCANVKISLSIDGGQTFPTVLAASTPNDGSQAVTLPSVSTSTARIRIEAIGNIFFDISNADFSIGQTAPDCSTAFEPNETQSQAILVQSGVANTAAISTASDVDYYKIVTTAKGTLTADLSGPSGVDYDLYVYNASGSQIGKSAGTTSTETVSLKNRVANTFYVKVIGKNGAFSSQCYTLTVTSAPNSNVATGNDIIARNAASMDKISSQAVVSVYPNPVHNELKINMGSYTDAVSVTVTDMHGANIISKTFAGAASFNMSKAAAGVYMVVICDKNGDVIRQSRVVKD